MNTKPDEMREMLLRQSEILRQQNAEIASLKARCIAVSDFHLEVIDWAGKLQVLSEHFWALEEELNAFKRCAAGFHVFEAERGKTCSMPLEMWRPIRRGEFMDADPVSLEALDVSASRFAKEPVHSEPTKPMKPLKPEDFQ